MIDRRTFLALVVAASLSRAAAHAAGAGNLTVIGNRLFLDISVNGRKVRALLDSAAESSFMDASFAKALGLEPDKTVVARGSGGDTDASLVSNMHIAALGL